MLGWCLCVMAYACTITTLLGDVVSDSFSFLHWNNVLWSCKVQVLFFKWGPNRCLSGPVSEGKPALFAQQDGYLTNSFVPKGSWGRCTLCVKQASGFAFSSLNASVSLFLVHGTRPHMISVWKLLENLECVSSYWVHLPTIHPSCPALTCLLQQLQDLK